MTSDNYALAIAPKPSAAIREQTSPETWFEHSAPDLPGGLTQPTYPGTLNIAEQQEVGRWLIAQESERPAVLLKLTQRNAIAKVEEYKTYFANPKYIAWNASNKLDRISQWRAGLGSALIANDEAVPISLDETGAGTPRSTAIVPIGSGKTSCAIPTIEFVSGSIGASLVVKLNCDTPGALIHWKIGAGAYAVYVASITLAAADVLTFYASADGYLDSTPDSFTNS